MSIEARPVKTIRSASGVVQRAKAHLTGFAFCVQGAFAGARVLALREAQDEEEITDEVVLDRELLPVAMDPELVERCRRLGMQLPQRYQAHPAEPDTPAETGTSDETAPATPVNVEHEEH